MIYLLLFCNLIIISGNTYYKYLYFGNIYGHFVYINHNLEYYIGS